LIVRLRDRRRQGSELLIDLTQVVDQAADDAPSHVEGLATLAANIERSR
jgi:hypothetical protein